MNLKDRKLKLNRLQSNYDGLTAKIENLVIQQRQIKLKLDTQKSLFTIESNAITLEDIQFSASNSKVWVSHFDNLTKYLNQFGERKYCEFNGNIYLVSDAKQYKMKSYGRYEDLK